MCKNQKYVSPAIHSKHYHSPLSLFVSALLHSYNTFCMLCAQINDNGVISFGDPYNVRTPLSFPLRSSSSMLIAPYWADVDTRGIGDIYYRQTADPSLLARATSEIRAAFSSSRNVTIESLLIATWDNVGYYFRNTDKVCPINLCTAFCFSVTMFMVTILQISHNNMYIGLDFCNKIYITEKCLVASRSVGIMLE